MALRVLHLVGSVDSEFMAELSGLYARDCLAATADPARYEAHVAYVTPDRRWRLLADLEPDSIAVADPMSLIEALQWIDALAPDVMVPQMFCLAGMTHYRALFDVLGIPYVGNAPATMSLTADKARARAVVCAAGVAVPDGQLVSSADAVHLAPPVVVKPARADNSLGVSLVRDRTGLDAAVTAACAVDGEALVERYVALGRELRCGIIVRDGRLRCLPLEEYAVDTVDKPIRDQSDKLARDPRGRLSLVAKDPSRAWIVDPEDPVCQAVWAAARCCHHALGCRHYSLFDFRIDPSGRPWFLEAGLYCSFARSSVLAMMAAADGVELEDLFAQALADAVGTAPARPGQRR
jgi:D-alanine-D-alanine ligase